MMMAGIIKKSGFTAFSGSTFAEIFFSTNDMSKW